MLAVLLSLGVGYATAQGPQGEARTKFVDKASPALMLKAAPEKTPPSQASQRGIAVSDPGMPEEINTPVKKPKGK